MRRREVSPWRGSLRGRLILIALAGVVPLVGLGIYRNYEARRHAHDDGREAVVRLAQEAEEGLAAARIRSGLQLLHAMAGNPALHGDDPSACAAVLAAQLKQDARYTGFLVADRDGGVLCTSNPVSTDVNQSDRDYFPRVIETRMPVVGKPILDRITQRLLLPVAHPLLDASGAVDRVLVAGLDLDWIGALAASLPALPGLTVTFWSEDGRVLYRHPNGDRWRGRIEPTAPITQAVLAKPPGEAFEALDLDGVTRVFALAHSREHLGRSLGISVGVERSTLTAATNRRLAVALGALAVVGTTGLIAMLVMAERLVGRPAGAIARAATRLAEGDLSVRVPEFGGELSAVADAFNRMVARLSETLASRAELEREVAERERIAVQLRQSEARARNIVESALDAVLIIDPEGRIVEFNPSAVRTFGRARSDAVGGDLAELIIPPAMREAHRRGLERYLRTGSSEVLGRRMEMSALRADRSEFPVELTVVRVANADPPLFAGFARDLSERRIAEAALRESEAHSGAIIESALDAIVVNDEHGRISEFNPSAERMFGRSREQAIGCDLAALIIPDSDGGANRQAFRECLGNAMPPFQGRRVEVPVLHADGHEFPVELTVHRIVRDGRPIFAGFMRDISERKQAERELSESELELRTIFDSVQDGILVADAHTRRFQKANASMLRMLGYGERELLALTLEDIHPEADMAAVLREFGQLLNGKTKLVPRLPMKRKDGTVFHADVSAGPLTLRGRDCLLGVFRDITERERSAALLREREEMYRALFETSHDAIMTLAPPSWKFTSGNPATVKMFGVSDEAQFVSLGPWQLSPETQPDGRPSAEKARDMIDTAMRQGAHFFGWTHRRLKGESFPATVLLTRVALGGQVFLQATVRDISEEKRAQEALNEANAALARQYRLLAEADRAKTEFMANVTHELRTPLNSVIGFAELLQDGVPGPLNARQSAFVADILGSGQRLLGLVEGILEMSRLDTADAALEREPVEVAAAVNECVAAHQSAAEARRVRLVPDAAAVTGRMRLDPRALRRMLDALIDNAIKFNREGGTVTVRARRAGAALQIQVADSGVGITREALPKLFSPFVQLDASLARRYGGVGLGLALARRLAQMHGGEIRVESEPGKGSTFTLHLPAEEPT